MGNANVGSETKDCILVCESRSIHQIVPELSRVVGVLPAAVVVVGFLPNHRKPMGHLVDPFPLRNDNAAASGEDGSKLLVGQVQEGLSLFVLVVVNVLEGGEVVVGTNFAAVVAAGHHAEVEHLGKAVKGQVAQAAQGELAPLELCRLIISVKSRSPGLCFQ